MSAADEITVIIPTYNRANTIERAIRSVLAQTIGELKIIVIDDASNDNTESIVRSIGTGDIEYIKLTSNRGACNARNIGIRNSATKYIAFLDSDDEWFPEKMEKQYQFLQETDADVVLCSVIRQELHRCAIFPDRLHDGDIHKDLLRGNFISTGMVFGKRDCFQEGFDVHLPRLQDWDMMLRISASYKVCHDHMPLSTYYIQKDSISMHHDYLKEACHSIYEKYKNEIDADIEARKNIHYQFAVAEIMTGGSDSLRWMKEAVRDKKDPKLVALYFACLLKMDPMINAWEMRKLKARCN